MIPSPDIKELTILDYLCIVWKRIWIVILSVAIFVGAMIYRDSKLPRIYQAEALLYIIPQLAKITGVEEVMYAKGVPLRDAQALYIHSPAIADRVIKELQLLAHPGFANAKDPVGKLMSQVKVRLKGKTNYVAVTMQGQDPKLITDIVNVWGEEAIREDIDKRIGTAKYGISWIREQMNDTLKKLQQAEIELNDFLRKNDILKMSEDTSALEGLRQRKVDLEGQLVADSKKYGDRHPNMVALRAELEKVNQNIIKETERVVGIQDKMVEYNVLRREVDTYSSVYNNLLKRSKQLDLSEDLSVSNLEYAKKASVPKKPISPDTKRSISGALIAGLLFGVGICYLWEYLDSTLKTSDDIEFYTQLRFLGYIPEVPRILRKEGIDLVTYYHPSSRIAESFRNIRVSLLFSSPEDKPIQTIMITSSIPREGKTFVATNLSVAFAQANEKTLLIDADLRKGRTKNIFETESEVGLTDVLVGMKKWKEVLLATPLPNLSLLSVGHISPSPEDLLGSNVFDDVLEEAKKRFQRIVIDVPPVLSVTDPLIVANRCDTVLFVIKGNHTSLNIINSAKQSLQERANITGAILNSTDVKKDRYYYYHYYYNPQQKKTST